MNFNHSVSDLVARIRNGYLAKKISIDSPVSKIRENILSVLKDEGYISSFAKVKGESKIDKFVINLKYHNSSPVVNEIKVISKPGKRVYCNKENIPLVKNGLGTVIISTSSGVVPDHIARTNKLGGELLLKIF